MTEFVKRTNPVEVDTLKVDRSLISMKEDIEHLIKTHGNTAFAELQWQPYSDSYYVAVYSYREETDEELAARKHLHEQTAASKAIRERTEYERLKSLFESK